MMKMIPPYPAKKRNYCSRFRADASLNPVLCPDHIFAAIRAHDRSIRTGAPRDYEMRAFEDGSVWLRNKLFPNISQRYTLAQLQDASRDFYLSPHRPLWKHIFWIWA